MKRLNIGTFMNLREALKATLPKMSEEDEFIEDKWDSAMRRKWSNIMESSTPKDIEVNDNPGGIENYTENLTCNLCGCLYTQYQGDKGCPYCGNQCQGWLTTAITQV